MEMDELLQRIDKARVEAIEHAKTLTAEADRDDPLVGLPKQIAADSSLAVARALDTILGLNTPRGKLLD